MVRKRKDGTPVTPSPGRPPKPKRPGLGTSNRPKVSKEVRERNKGLPALINETTTTYRVVQMLTAGKKFNEIADEMGTSEENVKNLIRRGYQVMNEQIEDLKVNWITLALHRLEILVEKQMKPIIESEDAPTRDQVDNIAKLTKLEMEILGFGAPKVQINNQQNNVFTNTMDRNSPLYSEAVRNGNGIDESEAPLMIPGYAKHMKAGGFDFKQLEGSVEDGIEFVTPGDADTTQAS